MARNTNLILKATTVSKQNFFQKTLLIFYQEDTYNVGNRLRLKNIQFFNTHKENNSNLAIAIGAQFALAFKRQGRALRAGQQISAQMT